MEKSNYFFSIYNEEKIDNDLEIEAIIDNMQQLEHFFRKSKRTLYNMGIKKKKNLHVYVTIDGKEYLIIVDKG